MSVELFSGPVTTGYSRKMVQHTVVIDQRNLVITHEPVPVNVSSMKYIPRPPILFHASLASIRRVFDWQSYIFMTYDRKYVSQIFLPTLSSSVLAAWSFLPWNPRWICSFHIRSTYICLDPTLRTTHLGLFGAGVPGRLAS